MYTHGIADMINMQSMIMFQWLSFYFSVKIIRQVCNIKTFFCCIDNAVGTTSVLLQVTTHTVKNQTYRVYNIHLRYLLEMYKTFGALPRW